MNEWNRALAGKTIDHVESREIDPFGDGENVHEVIAFVLADGTTVVGRADGGDLEGQYATFELLEGISNLEEALVEEGEHAQWYDGSFSHDGN